MGIQRGVLFCGSIGLKDAESVFRALSGSVGERAKRYPDGETGNRAEWIGWQEPLFAAHPQCEIGLEIPFTLGGEEFEKRAYFKLRDGMDAGKLEFPELGYASEAVASYQTFKRLRDAGTIPSGVRFQVSLPTPTAVIVCFIVEPQQAAFEAPYEKAMQKEIAAMLTAIPHEDLSIQLDVCHELLAYDGGPEPLHYEDILGGTVDRIARIATWVPDAVEFGIHLCYGDPGHQHIKEPADTGTAVLFSNALSNGVARRIDWIQLPVPRERDDDDYFAPLADLKLAGGTELYLGLVHMTGGLEGIKSRIAAAERHAGQFGIATECGFGRRDAATIPALLQLHAEAAG
jgi:hypothetical protein